MTRIGLAVLLFATHLTAQDKSPAYVFSLRAYPGGSPQIQHVTVTIAVGGMHAIRVYAEPSHTLLAAFVDSADGDFARQPWFAGLLPPGTRQVMVASLRAGMKGTIQSPLPAAGDTHLEVHTLRPGDDGAPASDHTFETTLPDLRRFELTVIGN